MKLWVDDERPAPSDGEEWVIARTSADAIEFLKANGVESWGYESEMEFFDEISLDHDLGGEDTGMRVVDWMASNVEWPSVVTIHTQNPVGRENLKRAVNAEAPADVAIFIKTW